MACEKPILKVLQKERVAQNPFWMMRQAGRYLPEYRELRARTGSFLNLCYTPKLAAEATLQPIRRFGMDAAIIFSDILLIPHALGMTLDYRDGEGPVLGDLDISKLRRGNVESHLSPIFAALAIVKKELPENIALIGFAGAPWTVATYMVEGGASKDFAKVKEMSAGQEFHELIDILVEETAEYLIRQIEAGAEVLQIFDSWAGVLQEFEFMKWVIKPTREIIKKIKKIHPEIPIIGFPKNAGKMLEKFTHETGIDAISLDNSVSLESAKALQKILPVQGNLNPEILLKDREAVIQETRKIKNALAGGPFIFNLGHGILPQTPIENVEEMIAVLRE